MYRWLTGFAVAALIVAGAWTHSTRAQPPGTDSFSICSITGTPPASGSCTPVSKSAPLPVTGTFSASFSGFAPAATGTPFTADTNAETGTLPAGEVVVAFNTSTTIPAYCKLGASSTTGDILIAPSSWFAFTVGVATQLTCITASSTAVINMVGGAGLPTGAGGGGGGSGGGGAVTLASGAVSSGAYSSGSIASGAYATGSIGSGAVASGAVASGAIASGAYASGSIGSGAVASGAFASGSIASGAIAAGAQVDLLTMRGTKAAGTAAANSLLGGCVYNSGGITLTDGQQAAVQCSSAGGALVSVVNTNANGQATMANSSPVVIASNQSANALWGQGATGASVPANAQYMGFNSGGNLTAPSIAAPLPVNNTGPYPIGATPYTATATGTTGATTATLAGASSVTTYICGFSIRANANAVKTGNATVTGVITATLNFTQWTAPNASGLGITEMIFSPCIPASGTNQSVAVVSDAPGTGGVVSVTAWGYKL